MRLLTALGCGGLLALGLPTRTPGPLPALPAAVPTLAGTPDPAPPADLVAPPALGVRPVAGSARADTAFHWTVGSRVHTSNGGDASVTGVFVRADSTATGAVLATVALGVKGTLRAGPILASDGGQRWKVAWDGSVTGWSRQIYLALEPVAPPAPVATTVTINQSVVELVGQRTPIVATVRDQTGAVMVAPIIWSSRTPAIAIVDTAGVVLGVAPGIDTVTATSGVAQGQTLVMIQAPAPLPAAVAKISLNVAGSVAITAIGGTFQGLAFPLDSAGNVLVRPVTWRSSAPAVAAVSPSGLVTAVANGMDTVVASAEGQSNFFLVFVGARPAPSVVWGTRALSLDALKQARPPCVVLWTPGVTTVCGPYARLDDSTGEVLHHFTVSFTVSP